MRIVDLKTNSWEVQGKTKDAHRTCKHEIRIFPSVKMDDRKRRTKHLID